MVEYLITSQQTVAAALGSGVPEEDLNLSGVAVLTFSCAIMERLDESCQLHDAQWISQRAHPYAAPKVVKRGEFQGLNVMALVPPMGASPLACIIEDLAACGVRMVFLVCAAWSLGSPVEMGDLIIPSFSVGMDGTSIHYGNTQGEAHAVGGVVDALSEACRARGVRYHVGGNATCEALYRITPDMADGFRRRGCLCMENGEASVVFTVTRAMGILGGVLFQPYIDLMQGWEPAVLGESYVTTCRAQADVVLTASLALSEGERSRRG